MLPIGPEIGCALSHFRCAREALELNARFLIVFEDDADIKCDLQPAIEELKNLDPEQPTVLQLHSYNNSILRKKSVLQVRSQPNHIVGRFYIPPKSAAAYCMNRAAIELYADKTVVEGVADWPPFANSFQFWGYFPSPVATIGGMSTIESMRIEAPRTPGKQEWYVLQIKNYLRLFSIDNFLEYSRSLGSRRAYLKFVLLPRTMFLLRYLNTTQHGNFPNIYKLR
jgi:GR25 family glycosyltransferase involved in LPS biosynthesis